jgi:hypothetical protein
MVCYITGCDCCGSEDFGLGSLDDDYVGIAGATPQFYSIAPYRSDYRFVNSQYMKGTSGKKTKVLGENG